MKICPPHGSICRRFAMRLDLAGDGNFSADHVSQNPPSNDYYLLDGGGIFPNRQEYMDFLKTAMERNTVCTVKFAVPAFPSEPYSEAER